MIPGIPMSTTPHDTPDFDSAHPVLSPGDAGRFEAALFAGDETLEWPAMQQAGLAIADAVLRDFREIGDFPERARVLVLAGKGHNGGDALITARAILRKYPRARAEVCFVFGERALRPLAARAWRELALEPGCAGVASAMIGGAYDLCLDGVFGFQFHPPIEERVAALIERVNALPARLRAAVDLPSGGAFRADFTYATGIVKTPALENPNSGRVRYLDLGFWACGDSSPLSTNRFIGSQDDPQNEGKTRGDNPSPRAAILTPSILAPLRALRSSRTDKRDYGHLFIVGGSRNYPGAVLMSALAALRSGAGLVTVFAPESIVAACAARAPEAMWAGWPETPAGNLALEGLHLFRELAPRATAALIGPGLSREAETLALAAELAKISAVPLVLDADALQPQIVSAGNAPRILTPHAGEYERVAKNIPRGAVVVRKGPLTRIEKAGAAYVSLFGGPVLARGGSGDLLAGLTGGLLAQTPQTPVLAACRGAVWHGAAADCLARARGQCAVSVTQLLDFLPEALRGANCQVCSVEASPQKQTWQSALRGESQ